MTIHQKHCNTPNLPYKAMSCHPGQHDLIMFVSLVVSNGQIENMHFVRYI